MGNKNQFESQDWRVLIQDRDYRLLYNVKNKMKVEEKKKLIVDIQEKKELLDLIKMRQQYNQGMPKIYHYQQQNKASLCNYKLIITIYVEHVPIRLKFIHQLTKEEAMYFIYQTLLTAQYLINQFSKFNFDEMKCGISNGKPILWINENYAECKPKQEEMFQEVQKEYEMVEQIFMSFNKRCKFQQKIKNFFQKRRYLKECIQFLDSFNIQPYFIDPKYDSIMEYKKQTNNNIKSNQKYVLEKQEIDKFEEFKEIKKKRSNFRNIKYSQNKYKVGLSEKAIKILATSNQDKDIIQVLHSKKPKLPSQNNTISNLQLHSYQTYYKQYLQFNNYNANNKINQKSDQYQININSAPQNYRFMSVNRCNERVGQGKLQGMTLRQTKSSRVTNVFLPKITLL